MRHGQKNRFAMALILLFFVVWSGRHIAKASFTGLNGARHFFLFDDALISMRYAWNLSHGNGLVWNAGDRVEGITNMLWTLYMAAGTAVFDKTDAILFVKISGILFALIGAFAIMKIAKEIVSPDASETYAVAAFALSLAYYPLAYWALMGMETGLLSALLLLATWLVLKHRSTGNVVAAIPVLLGLAFMTRPGAIIPASILIGYRFLNIPDQKNRKTTMVTEGLILSSFVIALTAFRYFYYGSVFPNTYTLKVAGIPAVMRIENGFYYTLAFLESVLPALLILLSAGLLKSFGKPPFFGKRLLLATLFSASVAYQVWAGGDPWPYWRMVAPLVPLLFVLCLSVTPDLADRLMGMARIPDSGPWSSRRPLIRRILVVLAMAAVIGSANYRFANEILMTEHPYLTPYDAKNVNTAVAIGEITTDAATVAVFWGGAIPYFTGLKAIDMLGKSDRHIASLPPRFFPDDKSHLTVYIPGHCKFDLTYSVQKLLPTYVEKMSWKDQDISEWALEYYVLKKYRGVSLWLLKDSKDVLWWKLQNP